MGMRSRDECIESESPIGARKSPTEVFSLVLKGSEWQLDSHIVTQ